MDIAPWRPYRMTPFGPQAPPAAQLALGTMTCVLPVSTATRHNWSLLKKPMSLPSGDQNGQRTSLVAENTRVAPVRMSCSQSRLRPASCATNASCVPSGEIAIDAASLVGSVSMVACSCMGASSPPAAGTPAGSAATTQQAMKADARTPKHVLAVRAGMSRTPC